MEDPVQEKVHFKYEKYSYAKQILQIINSYPTLARKNPSNFTPSFK